MVGGMTHDLTTGQRNRLIALARAGTSLPWGRSDPALERMRLVRKYRGPFDEEFADLTSAGLAIVQRMRRGS
jgi:hypothetical protein